MSLVESKAAFEQRCDEITTDGTLKAAFAATGIDSFSKLAFSVGTPQSPPTEAQFDAFARTVFGAGVTVGETSNLKRVHFEATTLVIASPKERVSSEDADSSTIKKIPPAEKRARQENQERRLSGVFIQGELAPSHQLLDLANHIYESGALIWVAPSKCTKRGRALWVYAVCGVWGGWVGFLRWSLCSLRWRENFRDTLHRVSCVSS